MRDDFRQRRIQIVGKANGDNSTAEAVETCIPRGATVEANRVVAR